MENTTVTIGLDEYKALISMKGRVNALHDLIKRQKYTSVEDALIILGFEEPEKDA